MGTGSPMTDDGDKDPKPCCASEGHLPGGMTCLDVIDRYRKELEKECREHAGLKSRIREALGIAP
jgi:hypothetical protein